MGNTKVESGTVVVFVLGMVAIAVLLGIGMMGFLPFAFQTAEIAAFVLFVFLVAFFFEVILEGKIRSLDALSKDPFAMAEVVFMVVMVATIIALTAYETVPPVMEPYLGLIFILAGAFMGAELKH